MRRYLPAALLAAVTATGCTTAASTTPPVSLPIAAPAPPAPAACGLAGQAALIIAPAASQASQGASYPPRPVLRAWSSRLSALIRAAAGEWKTGTLSTADTDTITGAALKLTTLIDPAAMAPYEPARSVDWGTVVTQAAVLENPCG